MDERTGIFISYSHEDRRWLRELLKMLGPVVHSGKIKVWADTEIKPGAKWRDEIGAALSQTDLGVLLVSPNYFSSEFIVAYELPILLNAAENGILRLLWIAVSSSLYVQTSVADYQAINDPSVPLDCLIGGEINRELAKIAQTIVLATEEKGVARRKVQPPEKSDQRTASVSAPSSAEGVAISRLSRDSLAVYGASREEVTRGGQLIVRKPPPVMNRTSAEGYASMTLAALLIAKAGRSADLFPGSIPPQLANLPGFRIDEASLAREGRDIVYRAWLQQDEGGEKEVWARVGTVEYQL